MGHGFRRQVWNASAPCAVWKYKLPFRRWCNKGTATAVCRLGSGRCKILKELGFLAFRTFHG